MRHFCSAFTSSSLRYLPFQALKEGSMTPLSLHQTSPAAPQHTTHPGSTTSGTLQWKPFLPSYCVFGFWLLQGAQPLLSPRPASGELCSAIQSLFPAPQLKGLGAPGSVQPSWQRSNSEEGGRQDLPRHHRSPPTELLVTPPIPRPLPTPPAAAQPCSPLPQLPSRGWLLVIPLRISWSPLPCPPTYGAGN